MQISKLWNSVLTELRLSVSSAQFQTWLAPTEVMESSDDIITIGCPNVYTKHWIEAHYQDEIASIFKRLGVDAKLEFGLLPAAVLVPEDAPLFRPLTDLDSMPSASPVTTLSPLNLHYTFEKFAVSGSNQLAYAAAQAVSQNPGQSYNPLLIYGGVGVGKTHLMQAIGHHIAIHLNHKKVLYCMGEDFTNEIIDAIRSKTTKRFKEKFRNVDVLLLDDVQFIAGKTTVQEELFHTFNALHRSGKQIVLVSDRPPKEMERLEARLRSRFEGGLIVDISESDLELRSAILLIKAEARRMQVPREVIMFIASRVKNNRELEGCLSKLEMVSNLNGRPPDMSLARQVLGDPVSQDGQKRPLTANEIIRIVASISNVSAKDICGKRRVQNIVLSRHLVMYLMRREMQIPLEQIGYHLGNRDHTTIMHGIDKIQSALQAGDTYIHRLVASAQDAFIH